MRESLGFVEQRYREFRYGYRRDSVGIHEQFVRAEPVGAGSPTLREAHGDSL
ncbi:hypothetical protein [Nocardia sp. CA-120079]|uniref:hypothetical protein n=1 Tax=Nocardia sp. CA-120079 TaxID=3239974 RepID=UPI003D99F7F8